MNIKVKAAGITAGLIVSAFAVAQILHMISEYLSPEQVMSAIGWGGIALLTWLFYKLVLTNLEYKESLKKLNEIK